MAAAAVPAVGGETPAVGVVVAAAGAVATATAAVAAGAAGNGAAAVVYGPSRRSPAAAPAASARGAAASAAATAKARTRTLQVRVAAHALFAARGFAGHSLEAVLVLKLVVLVLKAVGALAVGAAALLVGRHNPLAHAERRKATVQEAHTVVAGAIVVDAVQRADHFGRHGVLAQPLPSARERAPALVFPVFVRLRGAAARGRAESRRHKLTKGRYRALSVHVDSPVATRYGGCSRVRTHSQSKSKKYVHCPLVRTSVEGCVIFVNNNRSSQ